MEHNPEIEIDRKRGEHLAFTHAAQLAKDYRKAMYKYQAIALVEGIAFVAVVIIHLLGC